MSLRLPAANPSPCALASRLRHVLQVGMKHKLVEIDPLDQQDALGLFEMMLQEKPWNFTQEKLETFALDMWLTICTNQHVWNVDHEGQCLCDPNAGLPFDEQTRRRHLWVSIVRHAAARKRFFQNFLDKQTREDEKNIKELTKAFKRSKSNPESLFLKLETNKDLDNLTRALKKYTNEGHSVLLLFMDAAFIGSDFKVRTRKEDLSIGIGSIEGIELENAAKAYAHYLVHLKDTNPLMGGHITQVNNLEMYLKSQASDNSLHKYYVRNAFTSLSDVNELYYDEHTSCFPDEDLLWNIVKGWSMSIPAPIDKRNRTWVNKLNNLKEKYNLTKRVPI